ncbi:nucleotidyltransferase domain-containing protein [Agrococcus sp. SGAir0287]|uniref:nucleotidyltransferase domain-containing protein n=1 Tax=Agrococcus sp. SGAir0287 TaxID=2070347 RepID=UPI0010CD60A3|nr:nucleotidyltransferase domain-containing protein [Agrococcus sp. SGAir0287]QCR18811.1 nucleotidyltransferase [Agrococcus sp. SGAir0287]
MRTGYEDLIHRFVEQRFPGATSVIVAGSTVRGERTATSDVDLLLLGPEGFLADGADSLAATYAHEGETIEVFAYARHGFERWARRGVEDRRPVIVRMLLEGRALVGDRDLDDLRERWAEVSERGPQPTRAEVDALRYAVTDLLDDLQDASDELERRVIADALLRQVAALVLVTSHRWIATGKHLARELRHWDPERAARLTDPYVAGDLAAFHAAASTELDAAGGRLSTGFVR